MYVGDEGGRRIDKFDAAGHFLMAWGWGVADRNTNQLQTCTSTCFGGEGNGIEKGNGGSIDPVSIAVDSDPLSSSYQDVYVSSKQAYSIQKFGPNGEFLSMFGQGVDQGPRHPGNVCTAEYIAEGDQCGNGVRGTGAGQIDNPFPPLAVDEFGNVWGGDTGRLEEFSSAGAFIKEVALPGVQWVGALAIDTDSSSPSFEDIYFIERAEAGSSGFQSSVQKLSPAGVSLGEIDGEGHPNALTVDPATGDLFVSNQAEATARKATLLQYSPSGVELEAFGAGQVLGNPLGNALAFADGTGQLYTASNTEGSESAVQAFTLPAAGPYLREGSVSATPRPFTATLKALLTPEGAETKYHFEYVSESQFDKEAPGHGFDHATKLSTASLPADFNEHEVTSAVSGLTSEMTYRFRVLAENANGAGNTGIGSEEAQGQFTTLPPAIVESESARDVTASSATVEAEVNTLGEADEYQFEYLTEASYQQNLQNGTEPFASAALTPQPNGDLAPLEGFQSVSQHLQNLSPATVYRYRVTASSPGGIAHGLPLTFTTQATGGFSLPDGRVSEMVSPPNKYGAPIQAALGVSQASTAGSAITYYANAPIEAQPPGNSNSVVQALAGRSASGWHSRNINALHETATGASAANEYPFFSTDLSLGLLQPSGVFVASLSAEASEQTPFLRTDFVSGDPADLCTSSCYTPLVTAAPNVENVPSGTVFGREQVTGGECTGNSCGPEFVGASPDASHIVLQYRWAPLVEGAPTGSLYEWAGGRLSVVSILPNETPAATGTLGTGYSSSSVVKNAVSADGSRVVWSDGSLYLRDSAKAKTVQLDEVQGGSGAGPAEPIFQTASSDASRIFFTDPQRLTKDAGGRPDLYECEIVEEAGELKCRLTDLTGGSNEPAGVMGTIPGVSEDGSYIDFVDSAVLPGVQANERGEAAIAGQPNLYMRHAGATGLVAVLSGEDTSDWKSLRSLTARVSPNGHWFTFMSDRSLTGIDNRDAISGKHDEEVFLYHTGENGEGKLVCASCNPTSGRVHGVLMGEFSEGFGPGSLSQFEWGRAIAAILPGWTSPLYQSRYLSNSGRLFFDSFDALAPQDTNGTEDAYQFEPPGVGKCTEVSAAFVVASNGCVGLISSGTSKERSVFLDASQSGRDVFFLTTAQLSPLDIDSSIDIYDAHECGAGESCTPPVSVPVPACEGDACQSPVAAPEDPTPGSLTYQGPGNPSTPMVNRRSKPKSKIVRCRKSFVKEHGKCVKRRAKKAKRSNRRGK